MRSPAALRTSRILVADSDPEARELSVRTLQSGGYTVSETSSCRTTLNVLRSTHFEVLVLNLDMPAGDLDVVDVLHVVRSEMPHLRVIGMSMKRELLAAAEWLGAVATIDKVSAPDLLNTVRRLLVNR
jgi:DNA-binding NtrC family response regulator